MARRSFDDDTLTAPSGTRFDGTVKRLVADKGFGFILAADGEEYFVHRSAVDDWDGLREGAAVTFEKGQGPKGPRAENVSVV
jgi:CspA family cold shock protein